MSNFAAIVSKKIYNVTSYTVASEQRMFIQNYCIFCLYFSGQNFIANQRRIYSANIHVSSWVYIYMGIYLVINLQMSICNFIIIFNFKKYNNIV